MLARIVRFERSEALLLLSKVQKDRVCWRLVAVVHAQMNGYGAREED